MTRTTATAFIIAATSIIAGCTGRATMRDSGAPTTQPAAIATTNPADSSDARATFTLDQIEPVPAFDGPATAPADEGEAPLEAIELYARARDAITRNQPFSAVNLLEQAVRIDPHSFELHFALGSAYQRINRIDDAIAAYRRAAAIDPDDLVLQAELGRAYMQRGDVARGIYHLRLARMTRDYGDDAGIAAAVDYRLGLALQTGGYDRAALDVYDELLERLQNPDPEVRRNAEIAYLLNRPEFLLEQVARLYEKHGQLDDALRAWQFVAQRTPGEFAAASRVVGTLLSMGRTDEALRGAVELVTRFRASSESLQFLRDIYRRAGRENSLADELARLRTQRPQDRVVLFALADTLESVGRPDEAEGLLADAVDERDGDVEVVARLIDLFVERGQLPRAARALIESSARYPQITTQLEPLWTRLSTPGREDALRVDDLRRLELASDAEASRRYWLSRLALAWNRSSVALASLEQSIRDRPLFAPAFRQMLEDIWSEDAFDDEQKVRHSAALAAAAREAGDEALAMELEGAALLAQEKFDAAAEKLERAVKLAGAGAAPDLLMYRASAERGRNQPQRFEQLAWRIVSDHPRFEPAYWALFRHYVDRGDAGALQKLLTTWLGSVPDSVDVRLVEATVELRLARQREQAEQTLLRLFAQHPDRLDVLANLRAVYAEPADRINEFIDLLEQETDAHPHNYAALAMLVDVYASQQRLTEAARAIDAVRAALADDADRLYFVAHLYQRIDQSEQSEQTLERVVQIDPAFAPASNDLGYTWADAGKNLDRAEALIRRAVEAEPANAGYLDSLGWVLYKRGRFTEARQYLERAAADERGVDPVILDHLGDVLYRLREPEAAQRRWRSALGRIITAPEGTGGEPYNRLRLVLWQKIRQAEQSQPVSVAPVADDAAPVTGQAKN